MKPNQPEKIQPSLQWRCRRCEMVYDDKTKISACLQCGETVCDNCGKWIEVVVHVPSHEADPEQTGEISSHVYVVPILAHDQCVEGLVARLSFVLRLDRITRMLRYDARKHGTPTTKRKRRSKVDGGDVDEH